MGTEANRHGEGSTLYRVSSHDPYRRVAGIYDALIEPVLKGVRRRALEVLPPAPEWQVLDVGCGTGAGLAAYAEAGCSVAGVDVSEAMLDRAQVRLGDHADLHLTDGRTLPFNDNRFDLVTATMVLHEVPADHRKALVSEMARVAKPDSRLLIVEFRFGSLRGWRGPAYQALSRLIERFSGHYPGYRSFKASGGIPELLGAVGLGIEGEKIVAGGNLAIYVVAP